MPGGKRAMAFAAASVLGVSLLFAADAPSRAKVEFRRAEREPAEGLAEATVAGTDQKIYLHQQADLTDADIAEARVVDEQNRPAVEIVFTKDGQAKAAKVSGEHLDKPLAIVVDGKVLAAPVVRSKFSERIIMTGRFTKEEVQTLVKSVRGQ